MTADRTSHDPFAARSSAAGFPSKRLARAGVGEEAVANLEAWYGDRSAEQQAEFRRSITSGSDDAIRARFSRPDGDLADLKAEQLHELALAAGVATSGTKPEVIARLDAAQQERTVEEDEDGEQEGDGEDSEQGSQEAADGNQEDAQAGEGAEGAEDPPSGATEAQEPKPGATPPGPPPAKRTSRRGGSSQSGD